jgi:hypothetical protein
MLLMPLVPHTNHMTDLSITPPPELVLNSQPMTRRHRRPKPPSLKQQALNKTFAHQGLGNKTPALDAALKRLGELEALDD